jgi:hypothetical protein
MVVHGSQAIAGQMRIFLRGAERRMSEHLLNRSEVRALIEQVSCVGMPQGMRTDGTTGKATGISGNVSGHAPCGESASTMIQEQRSGQALFQRFRPQ